MSVHNNYDLGDEVWIRDFDGYAKISAWTEERQGNEVIPLKIYHGTVYPAIGKPYSTRFVKQNIYGYYNAGQRCPFKIDPE